MCEVWIGPDRPDPVLYSVSGRVKTVLGTFQNSIRLDRPGQPDGYPIIMQDRTNACGDRIVYDRPEDAAGWRQEHYHDAIDDVEDVLAIFAEMQEDRKNESGDITEPLTEAEVNTVLELKRLYLDSALGVLDIVGLPEGQY